MKNQVSVVEYSTWAQACPEIIYKVLVGNGEYVKVSLNGLGEEWCCLRSRRRFLKRFNLIHVEKWQNEYINDCVTDGNQWQLKVEYQDGKVKEVYGSNHYPKGYNRLRNLFDQIFLTDPLFVI